ncbi:MAG TPA: hypothetical protein VNE63_04930 [Candidatus Acidoferrales bacterium]|nr:hypothetical protein [Candidatus Acidoferrales bacterium]
MPRFLLSASLAGLLLTGVSVWAHPISPQSQSEQQSQTQQATKKVSGKVASIGNNGTSFTLEVGGSAATQTMQFVLDKTAKVQGNVKVGTAVTVEYAVEQGQNLALTVTAQG